MKSYLFLLLLVFIACNVEKKTNEIVLKDFPHDLLEQIADIFKECELYNESCIDEKMTDLYYNLTYEQLNELQIFILSPECQNDCVDIFLDVFKDEIETQQFCTNNICL